MCVMYKNLQRNNRLMQKPFVIELFCQLSSYNSGFEAFGCSLAAIHKIIRAKKIRRI